MLIRSIPTHEILQIGSQKWGISDRAIASIIAKARQQLLLSLESKRDENLALEIATRNELFRLALEKGKLQTALSIVVLLMP